MSNATENEFLGLVTHELRTPIAVVVGLAATLSMRRDRLTEAQVDECLERIRVQGERLARLVEDLLDLAQVEGGHFRVVLGPVHLAAAGRKALAAAPPPEGHAVDLAVPDDLWVVADPARLEQVLVNLLTNAYRYGGASVRLEAHVTPAGVLASVSDDGPGVPAGLVPTLFEKFSRDSRTGYGGAGLGLTLARSLVEAFGGRLWYERAHPRGARFSLLLDVTEQRPDNGRDAPERQRWNKGVLKVLVVDDEASMRFLLRTVFETEGFEVVEANHGAAALALAQDEAPDLVVTDLMMPMMGGRELIGRLRADAVTAAIPVLVASASVNANGSIPGADAVLTKPFDLDSLIGIARSLTRRDAG